MDALSAGRAPDATGPIGGDPIEWAAAIFVMDARQTRRLRRDFGKLLAPRRIVDLDIADKARFMDPALVDLPERRMAPHWR